MSNTTEDYLDDLLRQMTDELENEGNLDNIAMDFSETSESELPTEIDLDALDNMNSEIDAEVTTDETLGETFDETSSEVPTKESVETSENDDLAGLLSSLDELDATFAALENDNNINGDLAVPASDISNEIADDKLPDDGNEINVISDDTTVPSIDGLDMENIDLAAMLDEVTGQVQPDTPSNSMADSDSMDLADLLSDLGENDSELSEISDLLAKDEKSEVVDAGPGSMSSFLNDDSDDGNEFAKFLAEDSDEDIAETKEEKKARKKREKEAKKEAKRLAKEEKKKAKGQVVNEESGNAEADTEDFSLGNIIGGDEQTSEDDIYQPMDDGQSSSASDNVTEKKTGFFKRLVDFFTEEDEDEEAENLLDKTAVDIAADGAEENEAILNEADADGGDKKLKKKKDKKSKKDKKGKKDSDEDGGESDSKKEKKEKKKKEKKEKVPEPPLKKLPKKRIMVSSLLIASIGAIILFLSFFYPYATDLSSAKKHYVTGNYQKTYEYLSGHKLSGKNKELYNKTMVILKVQRHYDSYRNYLKMGMRPQALNALVQGIDAMDKYMITAEELGVMNEFNAAAATVVNELGLSFGVSVDQAREWITLEGTDAYTIAIYDYLGESIGTDSGNSDNNYSPEISIIVQQENEDNEVNTDL